MFKTLTSTMLILILILSIEVFFVSAFTLSLPSQLVFTALDNFSFYIKLLNANPAMAIELTLINNPVFIVQRLDEPQTSQLWGVYFMPINIITLFLLSLYISIIKKIKMSSLQWILVLFASSTLIFSMFYLRIQTCCTANPTWILDILLFSQVNNPVADNALWQEIYIQLAEYFTLIQFLIAAVGITILYIVYNTGYLTAKTPK